MEICISINILKNFRKIDTMCAVCEEQASCPELDDIRNLEMRSNKEHRWINVTCNQFKDRRKIER